MMVNITKNKEDFNCIRILYGSILFCLLVGALTGNDEVEDTESAQSSLCCVLVGGCLLVPLCQTGPCYMSLREAATSSDNSMKCAEPFTNSLIDHAKFPFSQLVNNKSLSQQRNKQRHSDVV